MGADNPLGFDVNALVCISFLFLFSYSPPPPPPSSFHVLAIGSTVYDPALGLEVLKVLFFLSIMDISRIQW